MPDTSYDRDFLKELLDALYEICTPEERKELDRYDRIPFVDANEEIKQQEEQQKQ